MQKSLAHFVLVECTALVSGLQSAMSILSSSHFDWIRVWSLINFVTILMSTYIFTPLLHD